MNFCVFEYRRGRKLLAGRSAKKLFALRVPRSFIDRMEKGNPDDPLLRQVLTSQDEFVVASGFSTDPLEEQHSVVPGLLHKYHNRALLLVKGGCAVNCRYCFRRHFPMPKIRATSVTGRLLLSMLLRIRNWTR